MIGSALHSTSATYEHADQLDIVRVHLSALVRVDHDVLYLWVIYLIGLPLHIHNLWVASASVTGADAVSSMC